MPSTTLPAPEIEIGSRLPVNRRMPRIHPTRCEPVHTAIEIAIQTANEPKDGLMRDVTIRSQRLVFTVFFEGLNLTAGFHPPVIGPDRMRPMSHRAAAARRWGRLVGLGAGKGVSQAIDGLG